MKSCFLHVVVVVGVAVALSAVAGCHPSIETPAVAPASSAATAKAITSAPAPRASANSHRAVAEVCPKTHPPSEATRTPTAAPECKADAECKAQPNGRCTVVEGNRGRGQDRARCVYDACFTDADCGARTACACSDSGNMCSQGNCATDADCGTEQCTRSAGSCGPEWGYEGYFCHSAKDECHNDDECGPGFCQWRPEVSVWKCAPHAGCVG